MADFFIWIEFVMCSLRLFFFRCCLIEHQTHCNVLCLNFVVHFMVLFKNCLWFIDCWSLYTFSSIRSQQKNSLERTVIRTFTPDTTTVKTLQQQQWTKEKKTLTWNQAKHFAPNLQFADAIIIRSIPMVSVSCHLFGICYQSRSPPLFRFWDFIILIIDIISFFFWRTVVLFCRFDTFF